MDLFERPWAIVGTCAVTTVAGVALGAVLPPWWTSTAYCPEVTAQGDTLSCAGLSPLVGVLMLVVIVATAAYVRRTAA